MRNASNPPLSPWVMFLFLIVALVLCVGVGLLVAPTIVTPRWLWQIAPYNASFLGAIYLAELSVVIPLLLNNRLSPGRSVLPSALTFVALISVISLFYLDHFDLQRLATYLWLAIYWVPTLILIYLLWVYRHLFASVTTKAPHPWPALLLIESALFFVYGVGLLIAPHHFALFWPWQIDVFHARMYSAFFFTLAVGSFVIARGAGRLDVLTLGIAQLTTGIGVIGGLLLTDLTRRRVIWDAAETWLWIGMFAVIGLIGVLLIGVSYQMLIFADASPADRSTP